MANLPNIPPEHNTAPRKARLIAYYLPQFHPIPENDLWWGKGFTEWTNVAKARPLFKGHHQPNVPADLGFYDLRLPEAREAQAALAQAAGIEGFCYWHYWFAGRRILERPFNEVLESGKPDFPFCLGWANQTWSGIWYGASNRILIEQTYPGQQDYEKHFHTLLRAFLDPRYICVRGKPVFLIYHPPNVPDIAQFIKLWQSLALKNGLPGIHFVAHVLPTDPTFDYEAAGFSGMTITNGFGVLNTNCRDRATRWYSQSNRRIASPGPNPCNVGWLTRAIRSKIQKTLTKRLSRPRVFEYAEASLYFLDGIARESNMYPCVIPNWDNSPRSGMRSVILRDSTPQLFQNHLRDAISLLADRPGPDRLVFVKSWNEWAEGNYLEPDLRFGHQYLKAVRDEVCGPTV